MSRYVLFASPNCSAACLHQSSLYLRMPTMVVWIVSRSRYTIFIFYHLEIWSSTVYSSEEFQTNWLAERMLGTTRHTAKHFWFTKTRPIRGVSVCIHISFGVHPIRKSIVVHETESTVRTSYPPANPLYRCHRTGIGMTIPSVKCCLLSFAIFFVNWI